MRPARALVVLVMVALCATPAAADRRSDAEARRLFLAGNRAFDEGRYSDALAAYRASNELVPRASTVYNIASCRDRLGDAEGAVTVYRRFIELAGTGNADLRARADERLAILVPSLRLAVPVMSSPPGAAVRVDASESVAGYTPASLQLSPGEHELHVSAPHHRAASVKVVVVPGTPAHAEVNLEPLATVTITAEPPDATIEIIGEQMGTGRLTADVPPGRQRVTVSHRDYRTTTVELEAVVDAPLSQHVTLEPNIPIVVAQPERQSRGGGLRTAGLVTSVAGGLALGFAAQQAFAASGRSDDAQRAASRGMFDAGALDDALAAQTRMYIFTGVGVAALATGGVLFWMGHRQASDTATALVPAVGQGAIGLVVGGRL